MDREGTIGVVVQESACHQFPSKHKQYKIYDWCIDMRIYEEILTDARAYMKSRVILTASELDLFTRIDGHPLSAEDLSASLRLDSRALTRLLDTLVTFALLEKHGTHYQLTEKGAFLSSRHPQSIRPMLLHFNHLWKSWSGLTDVIKRGSAKETQTLEKWTDEERSAFIGAMHVIGRDMAEKIAADYNMATRQRLLDVGGGSGTYTIAFLRRNPALKAILFDLPSVIPMARERLLDEGMLDRVELVAGDFYADPLPAGCDVALLSAIIHQNSPEENLELYHKVFQALVPRGVLLIRDHVMEPSRVKPPAGALFALNMLVNTRGGDTYTFTEIERGLHQAGFTSVRLLRKGIDMDCLVEALKPVS